MTITTEQLAMLGGIMATAMKDAMSAAGGTTPGSTLGGITSPIGETYTGSTSGSVVFQQAGQKESVDLRYLEAQVRKLTSLQHTKLPIGELINLVAHIPNPPSE